MANIAKTVVATGASSGLGFEAIKQLLGQTEPYRFILGCRNVQQTQQAYDSLDYDSQKHTVDLLPLELSDLRTVRTFANSALQSLGDKKLDYLFLNAALSKGANEPGPHGSKWCEALVVNHSSQHYLITLLREKLASSKSRIVVVSSGAIHMVKDPKDLPQSLKAQSGLGILDTYAATKFVQLLNAHYWRRQFQGTATVVTVSPGLIPHTGLSRHWGPDRPDMSGMKDAKSVPEGAKSLLAAFTRDDFPENPDQIFLTSWGEWWSAETIAKSLDKKLQDEWSFSQEEMEKDQGL